jgi:hypothetical protein
MKKTVVVILVVVLLVVLAYAGYVKKTTVLAYFSNGPQELQTALDAKASAKSFQMTTKIASHDDNVMETHFYVSCPDRERITLKIASVNREMIRIGQRFYLNEDGTWYYKDVDIATKDWSPCGKNPGLPSPWAMLTEGRDLLSVFVVAQDKFLVKLAEPTKFNGNSYKTWAVSMNHNGEAAGFKYLVLLDENRRPVVISTGGTSFTEYSDWDKPVAIEAPANAVPFPENTEGEKGAAPVRSHLKGM